MLSNLYSGFFVDIEGIDGAGQTTQVSLVSQSLKKEGLVVVTTEAAPRNTPIGQLIRQALNHKVRISLQSLEFLFAADHSHRQEREIVPAIKKSKIVIADRSVWSFIAYGALKMDHDWLFNLVKNLIFPDLTIFLQVSPPVAMGRIVAYRPARDFFEKEKTLAEIAQNYKWLAQKFSDRIRVVNGERPKEEVTEEILKIIKTNPKFKILSK